MAVRCREVGGRSGDAELTAHVCRVADYLVSVQEDDGYLGTYAPERRFMHRQPPKPGTWDGAPSVRTWDIWTHSYLILGLLEAYRHFAEPRYLQAARRIGDLCWRTLIEDGIDITELGNHHGMSATVLMDPAVELYFVTGEQRYLDLALHILRTGQSQSRSRLADARARRQRCVGDRHRQGLPTRLEPGRPGQAAQGDRQCGFPPRGRQPVAQHPRKSFVAGRRTVGRGGASFARSIQPGRLFQSLRLCGNLFDAGVDPVEPGVAGDHRRSRNTPKRSSARPTTICSARRRRTARTGAITRSRTAAACIRRTGAAASRAARWRWRNCRRSPTRRPRTASRSIFSGRAGRRSICRKRAVSSSNRSRPILTMATSRSRIAPQRAARFVVKIRIPSWADEATLAINGEPIDTAVEPGQYATIERVWQPGDEILAHFPMRPRTHRAVNRNIQESRAPDGSPVRQQVMRYDYLAITRGPLVYAAGLIDGFKIEETLRLPQGPEQNWLKVLPPEPGQDAPRIEMQPEGRASDRFQPVFLCWRSHGRRLAIELDAARSRRIVASGAAGRASTNNLWRQNI